MTDSTIPNYYRYWGKTEKDTGKYHLLPYHCLDVAAVGWILLDPDKSLCQRLAKQLNVFPEWLQCWVTYCLCLHDIGKFATAFQGIVPDLSPLLVPSDKRMPYSERHDSLGFLLWQDILSSRWLDCVGMCFGSAHSDLAKILRYVDPWMEIVTGHHGEPPKRSHILRQNFFTVADEDAAYSFLGDITTLFLGSFDGSLLGEKDLKNLLKLSSWQLAGIVVLADWLGSGRAPDTFYQAVMPLDDYWQFHALPHAETVFAKADLYPSAIETFTDTSHLFPFISLLTPLQNWAEKHQLETTNHFFILEDVTGAGKTEAALVLAHRIMDKGLSDGIYVALPTMATANSMYTRLGKAYRKIFSEDARPSLVLAHGARHLSEAFRSSIELPSANPSYQIYADDRESDEEPIEAYCSAWLADSRKKAFLAEIGVGTLDQALLAVLPAKHQSLRMLGLARKVLIVDEVHSYDPYMNQLLQTLIEVHARQGGSIILLSATLPQQMREKYIFSFCEGTGIDRPRLEDTPSYPLATHIPTLEQIETPLATRGDVERTVSVIFIDEMDDALNVLYDAFRKGQCVCWIRNTVKDARIAHDMIMRQEWMDKSRLILFHSRFAMTDRRRIEAKTLDLFDKNSTAKKRQGQILIATQVVEQSLDLDFDVMISDLAPIDLLIQRAGRLHRHVRDNAGNPLIQEGAIDRRGELCLYIFGPMPTETPDEDWLKSKLPGTQSVYKHVGQLWLTQQQLYPSGRFSMPADARKLIEGVYGEKAQDLIPDSLLSLSWDAEGEAGSHRGMARINALKLGKGYTRSSAEDSGGWDKESRIPTRLGIDNITVALARFKDNKLWPYAQDNEFPWELSLINLPKNEWKKVQGRIPLAHNEEIKRLKEEVRMLKWVEVLPMTEEVEPYYDPHMGWGLNKEEKDESY
ncbi:MAG: CRISPR-associated helicase Cas3' [Deltaproteobacteria bacterium]|nr:CRISPR-associated helicase Cas3' [Deltaproteobacteria bacterium]